MVGTYPQKLSMEKILEYLIKSFLLGIFFKDFLQEDPNLTNLCICWE